MKLKCGYMYSVRNGHVLLYSRIPEDHGAAMETFPIALSTEDDARWFAASLARVVDTRACWRRLGVDLGFLDPFSSPAKDPGPLNIAYIQPNTAFMAAHDAKTGTWVCVVYDGRVGYILNYKGLSLKRL